MFEKLLQLLLGYRCKYCGKRFRNLKALGGHVSHHNPLVEQVMY